MQTRILSLSAVLIVSETTFAQVNTPAAPNVPAPGTVFRDFSDCPEMVVVPAGNFTIGSSDLEKSWAVSHGSNAESVSDESPQHNVSLRPFAIGKYDVT